MVNKTISRVVASFLYLFFVIFTTISFARIIDNTASISPEPADITSQEPKSVSLVLDDDVQLAWVRTYNGLANDYDRFNALAVDNLGNSYVTGYVVNGPSNLDYVTVKYDLDGNQIWVREDNLNGLQSANDIALDAVNNVYVTGASGTTIKYDSNGSKLWFKNVSASLTYLALDSSANVYIGGNQGFSATSDYFLVKYDTSGNESWTRVYNGTAGGEDVLRGIVVDSLGNTYVTGNSREIHSPTQNFDIVTIKYDTDGNQVWIRKFNGAANTDDGGNAIFLDNLGNIYVAGSTGNASNKSDMIVVKYDSNGNQLWFRTYNGEADSNDSVADVVTDNNGNVCITGPSDQHSVQPWDYDYVTIKYDSEGNQLWLKKYTGPLLDASDYPKVITVDNSGNIYVGGGSPITNMWDDLVVIKYDKDGNQQWLKSYGGTSQYYDQAIDMQVDNQGQIYVAGYTCNTGTQSDATIMKYSPVSREVGYWKFDEGTGVVANDSSGNNNNGELINGPSWVAGRVGNALQFNGNSNYVRIADSTSLSSPSANRAITVMGWVRPDPGLLNVYGRVVASHWTDESGTCTYGDPSNGWVLEAHQNDGKYHSIITAGDGVNHVDLVSNTSVQEGVWQHVAFTWDGSTVKFYMNGQLDATAAYTGNLVDSGCFVQIGKTDRLEYTWKGLIDEVKIYDRALSAEEIKHETSLVGYWKFDEGTGSVANDSSGRGNNGTLINGPTWASGKFGSALSFDGVNDYVQVPDADSLDMAGPFTIMAWIHPQSLSGGYKSFINKYFNYILQTTSSSTGLRCAFDVAPGGAHAVDSPDGTLTLNQWQHVTGVWDGNTIRIYKNGEEVGSSLQGAIIPQVQNTPLYIATEQAGSQFFNGLIDDVKVFNVALSQSEIKSECGDDCQQTGNYNLTIASTSGGTTNPTPGGYSYPSGSSVQVRAIPDACYNFDHWQLDGVNVGSANPYTVVMDGNHTLQPVFTVADYRSLSISATSGGTTNPAPGTYSYTCSSSVQVSAGAYSSYVFDHWQLDEVNVGSANPYSVLMNANHTLNAVFRVQQPSTSSCFYDKRMRMWTCR